MPRSIILCEKQMARSCLEGCDDRPAKRKSTWDTCRNRNMAIAFNAAVEPGLVAFSGLGAFSKFVEMAYSASTPPSAVFRKSFPFSSVAAGALAAS